VSEEVKYVSGKTNHVKDLPSEDKHNIKIDNKWLSAVVFNLGVANHVWRGRV